MARTERGNARGGATKAGALFTHFLTQKYTPLSTVALACKVHLCKAYNNLWPTWQMDGEEEEVEDDRGAEAVDGHGGAEAEGGTTAHAAHADIIVI